MKIRIFQAGEILANRFRIDGAIASGSRGSVYRATDQQTGRPVVVKMVAHGQDEVLEGRFRREARLIFELRHPNVVEIVDFGQAEDVLYLATEFIDGERLTAMMQSAGALGYERAVGIALQIANALLAAHEREIVHRGIKPDNIMIRQTADGRDEVKVLDFGVAKINRHLEGSESTVETQVGKIVGTLRYISPEQISNGEITPRTDMYLFGCVLYELLSGRRVFEYDTPADCAVAHAIETPKPPEVEGVKLPRALVDFVMRCLAKEPEARPADARSAVRILTPLVS